MQDGVSRRNENALSKGLPEIQPNPYFSQHAGVGAGGWGGAACTFSLANNQLSRTSALITGFHAMIRYKLPRRSSTSNSRRANRPNARLRDDDG